MALVAIYFYRIFIMRVIVEEDKLTFKGLSATHTILKEEILDIYLLKQNGSEINKIKYIKGGDYRNTGDKTYVLVRKNNEVFPTNLSMFNAATDDYISFEYTPGIENYLDTLLGK